MAKRTPPTFYEGLFPQPDDAIGLARRIGEDGSVEDIWLKNAGLIGIEETGVAFRGMVFTGCRFLSSKLRRASMADVRFENCDLSGCDLSMGRFTRVEFTGCKLMGTIFAESGLQDVLFRQCTADYANYDGCDLHFYRIR